MSSALSGSAKSSFESYLRNDGFKKYKAFASDTETGAYGRTWSNPTPGIAIDEALRLCAKRNGAICSLYAAGNAAAFSETAMTSTWSAVNVI